VSFSRRQRISLGLLLAALVLLLLKIAWPFVSSLVLATMVATVVHPANKRLNSRPSASRIGQFADDFGYSRRLGSPTGVRVHYGRQKREEQL
jgi:membrane protein implicated in regulation of membrane protease activity